MALKATKRDEAADRLLTRAVLCWPGHDCPQTRPSGSGVFKAAVLPRPPPPGVFIPFRGPPGPSQQARTPVLLSDEFEIAAGGVEQEMSHRSFVVLHEIHRETTGDIEIGFR